ncbi:MAG: HAD family phosphatase [Sphingobacteriia bacterium]|nr:HAD family phosphatase [Sphingobacteriia bacterium]
MSKTIIFDCDGVLVDSEIIAHRVEAELLKKFGYSISTEECLKKFIGINVYTICKIIKSETGIEIPLEALNNSNSDLLMAFKNELQPLMTEFLSYLEKENIPRCVASSSNVDRILLSLKVTDQLRFFKENNIFSAHNHVSKPKPAPDVFLYAAKQMNVDPKNCLVIEDSPVGIEAALNANMEVVCFLGGKHTQFPWYKEKFTKFNVPVVSTNKELIEFTKNYFAK